MTALTFKKSTASFLLSAMLAVQVLSVASFLMIPKQSQAFSIIPGLPDTTVIIGNIADTVKTAALAALRQIAVDYANKFLTRFIAQLTDKYKIRNFLYYDQVLTTYYFSHFIADKIEDPDLRQIYSLLEAGYITGEDTGYIGQPDPNSALFVRLKNLIHQKYIDAGGIDEGYLANPPDYTTGYDYYAAAYQADLNSNRSFEQQYINNYSYYRGQATVAAQLETIVGKSLKAGRVVGGTCSFPGASGYNPANFTTQEMCEATGVGTWKPSALDTARAFIDNPSEVIGGYLDGAIGQLLNVNFNPDNYAAQIGQLIGNFIFKQLSLDNDNNTLTEYPGTYIPAASGTTVTISTPIDIDADGITDGYDVDGDNALNSANDICIYGGANGGSNPPCLGSTSASTATASSSSSGSDNGSDTPCATQEEIDQWLQDNPGDTGRVEDAFDNNICSGVTW